MASIEPAVELRMLAAATRLMGMRDVEQRAGCGTADARSYHQADGVEARFQMHPLPIHRIPNPTTTTTTEKQPTPFAAYAQLGV